MDTRDFLAALAPALTDADARLATSFLKAIAPLPGRSFTVGALYAFVSYRQQFASRAGTLVDTMLAALRPQLLVRT